MAEEEYTEGNTLQLCADTPVLRPKGRMPKDQNGESTCLESEVIFFEEGNLDDSCMDDKGLLKLLENETPPSLPSGKILKNQTKEVRPYFLGCIKAPDDLPWKAEAGNGGTTTKSMKHIETNSGAKNGGKTVNELQSLNQNAARHRRSAHQLDINGLSVPERAVGKSTSSQSGQGKPSVLNPGMKIGLKDISIGQSTPENNVQPKEASRNAHSPTPQIGTANSHHSTHLHQHIELESNGHYHATPQDPSPRPDSDKLVKQNSAYQNISGPIQLGSKGPAAIVGTGIYQVGKQQPIGARLEDVISPKKKKQPDGELNQGPLDILNRVKSHGDYNFGKLANLNHNPSTLTPHIAVNSSKPLYAMPLEQVCLTKDDSPMNNTPGPVSHNSQAHHPANSSSVQKKRVLEEVTPEESNAVRVTKRAVSPGSALLGAKKTPSTHQRLSSKDVHASGT